ncbi:mechanosensitive ion channel protein MscS [Roseivirga seohaensis]|uniref:Mechanosensitive ion channel protein MscS n=1 Tax=Roseivirga seohaensis TaxID=1914963 RepID=A0A150Y1R4_9BACT|nr:mechanosensitive ion channel family protein [Roseivirga seohaensis]KYG84943.1 mechanosensitive ion channel protein MscS [Roseivirga seohaensis]
MKSFHDLFSNITEHPLLNNLILAATVFVIAHALLRMIRVIMNKFINKSSEDLRVDPTKYKFLKNAMNFLVYMGALIIIFLSIPELEDIGLGLFASAGVFAAILGFASQAAFSNIISGIFLVIFKPFRVDDIIKVNNIYHGTVEDINLRHTVIRDFENRRLIIPNSVIGNETIQNFNIVDSKIKNFIMFGISYDSNLDLAIRIIQEEAMKHPYFLDNRTNEELESGQSAVLVRLVEFGDSSINLRAQVWSADPSKAFDLKCDIYKSIKARFDKEGIEIPFPHRTIVYKNAQN